MRRLLASLLIFAGFAIGCQSAKPVAHSENGSSSKVLQDQPLAYVAGQPVTIGDLQPVMIEIAGREVLAEYVLDKAIAKLLGKANLAVTEDDLFEEKKLLLVTLSSDPDTAARLLNELRQRRRLGDKRFQSLLRRNAGLRKLVAGDVHVTPAAVQQAYEQNFGKRYRARVIVVPTLDLAAKIRQQLTSGQTFADLAVEHSTDASAPSGGMLPLVSPVDATYPKVIRDTLEQLEVGQVSPRISPPVSVEGGFAILKLEATIPPVPMPLDQVRKQMEQQVRMSAQRLLMDQLARSLLAEARVVVLNADLNRAWNAETK